ncbi:MAG TPA: acetolactate synthase large subunit [Candidatus Acidoferrum sp.]|nr:acetolactate synthase large subunit [Candidatus Acidoferrum sp.]
MNGAESLVGTLAAGGIRVCFSNPGTSEMHIVGALAKSSEIRCVLALLEGVVSAAADGYARMSEIPASTLLHLGPGLANGVANLHNASRARVPMVNIVGQHALTHLKFDAPLTSDIEAIARPYSKWLRTAQNAETLGRDAADAIVAARTAPGQIATLIVPADAAWGDGGAVARFSPVPKPPMPPGERIERAAKMLKDGAKTGLLIAGNGLYGIGLKFAGQIATATNAELLAPYNFARIERGVGTPPVTRIPYVPGQAAELLKDFRRLILVGADAPVAYFAHPARNAVLSPAGCDIHALAVPGEDYIGTLEALASEFPLRGKEVVTEKSERLAMPSGAITLPGLADAVAALLPEGTIVADESMTSGRAMLSVAKGAAPHDWLACTGGAIGIALPQAVGAAIACPDRKVLCLTADGSGMYTLQALWTMARERLNITTVVFANREYSVLKREFASFGLGAPGARALDMFEIGRPDLDWTLLAEGMGVAARKATTLDDFGKALEAGFDAQGPTLVEVVL